jgi:hypothetical protein
MGRSTNSPNASIPGRAPGRSGLRPEDEVPRSTPALPPTITTSTTRAGSSGQNNAIGWVDTVKFDKTPRSSLEVVPAVLDTNSDGTVRSGRTQSTDRSQKDHRIEFGCYGDAIHEAIAAHGARVSTGPTRSWCASAQRPTAANVGGSTCRLRQMPLPVRAASLSTVRPGLAELAGRSSDAEFRPPPVRVLNGPDATGSAALKDGRYRTRPHVPGARLFQHGHALHDRIDQDNTLGPGKDVCFPATSAPTRSS